jgi:multiple sugar transport system ATP-binding protein
MATLVLENVSRRFAKNVWAVRDLSLTVRDGELLALVGPSGSGKTTTLRLVAGLDRATSGKVVLDGRALDGIPPWKRNVALVFQHEALCPHLSVRENVLMAQKWARNPPGAHSDERRIEAIARRLGIEGLWDRRPAELSGGQRRRAAVVRALARRPAVLLLDEPLTGLDPALKEQLRDELVGVQRELGVTTILVTHDQAQALAVGDRVAVIDEGRIEQVDSPEMVFNRPANLRVARLVGEPAMNLWPAGIEQSDGERVTQQRRWKITLSSQVAALSPKTTTNELVYGIRPSDILTTPVAPAKDFELNEKRVTVAAKLTRVEFRGERTWIYGVLDEEGTTIVAGGDPRATWTVGQRFTASWEHNRAHWFDGHSGIRLGSQQDQ